MFLVGVESLPTDRHLSFVSWRSVYRVCEMGLREQHANFSCGRRRCRSHHCSGAQPLQSGVRLLLEQSSKVDKFGQVLTSSPFLDI